MTRKNKADLADRVSRAAETLLADRKQVSFVDVLVVIGWLAGSHVSSWRQGRLDCLEEAMQVDPSCISQAMMLFESWTTGKGLSPCVTDYVARSPERQPLRFSRRGDPALEERYRTHWISPDLPERPGAPGEESEQASGTGRGHAAQQGVEVPSLRPARRSPDHGEARTGMSAMCRPGRSRISVFGRCVADKTGEGEECPSRRRRTLQPKPPSLRAARPAGRAAGACRRAARDIGAKTAVAGVHRRPPTSSMWRRRSAGSS